MKIIQLTPERLTAGVTLSGNDLFIPEQGGGILLPELMTCTERFLTFFLCVNEAHSSAFELIFSTSGETDAFTVRFGILGNMRSLICIDLDWMDAHVLFPESMVGQQKVVCHGHRVSKQELTAVRLVMHPCYHCVKVTLEQLCLADERPEQFPLTEQKLVDKLGQNCRKDWPGKIHSLDELGTLLQAQAKASEKSADFPFADWSKFGGWKEKKLTKGTGFFSRIKTEGRWWLVDPEGYAFFSVGPDCVRIANDARIDGLESLLQWLPSRNDPDFAECFSGNRHKDREERIRRCELFSFEKANLIRTLGPDWYPIWQNMILMQLKQNGMNTLGNWSDSKLFDCGSLPYVTSLPEFPTTKETIFRDFPDVFSDEYLENARICAEALIPKKDDPFMIGYFLRNEPAWAYVDHLILADEVLRNPAKTCCKKRLIQFLCEKYTSVEAWNTAWNSHFSSFDDLYQPLEKASSFSANALADQKAFSKEMLSAYVGIPSAACRKTDPNHMILGMRWAWISDPDLVCGWENFDVYSINCYSTDPTAALENVTACGVDLPILIGEFHFGALDRGLTATGLEAVKTQQDRGIAYRYYCERAAAHPNGVGCHYFQCYDQFLQGRFDGENYNIGLFDVCLQPYTEMTVLVKECSRSLYPIMSGEKLPTEESAEGIPMIAY